MSDEPIFEGFERPTRNYFPMPNEWIDICSRIKSLAEIKVIFYILRHTWGYQEYGITKVISFDEFMSGRKRSDGSRIDSGTGLSRQSVIDGLNLAVKHGYIICEVDASDLARVKKSYALKMRSGVKNLDPQISSLNSIPQGSNIYTSEVKEVDSRGLNSTPRSEKDTIERHLGNTPKEKQEAATSSEDRNAPALFIHPEHSFLSFDSLERPSLMVISFVDDDRAEVTNKSRGWIARGVVETLASQGIKLQIRKEKEHVDDAIVDAPANVYHFEAEKKKRTDPRIPVVASHSQVDIGNDDFADRPTEKRPAVKKGQANDHTTMDTSRYSVVSNLGASDTSGAGTDRQTRRSQNEGLEITQTPGAGSPPAATPPGGSTAASVQASRSGPPADAAQRTASSPGTPSGAVQASVRDEKPHMALTAKQIQKQLEKRQDEILALYASKIGRKPSRSKANLDGALKLAQDDATDEDIGTTIEAILADSFLAKNLSLTFVHSKLDALARKPIPIQQNGKAKRDENIGVSGLPRLKPLGERYA